MTTVCPRCNDPVPEDDASWHRSCFLAVLGVIMYRRYG